MFALSAAPPEQLMPLLLQWQAADGDSCWELFSAAESASSLSAPQEQQWLEQQLRQHLAGLAVGSTSSGGMGGNAAALGCLLALGQRGLTQWERLLGEQQQTPRTAQQQRQALLLGLTGAALLALQPAELDEASLEAAAAAAEARLAAHPTELLRLVQQLGQQPGAPAAALASSRDSASEGQLQSAAASDAGEGGSGSATPTPRAVIAAAAAKAAAGAADRFRGLLLAVADAQQLQQLLPGVDAAALSGSADSRRQLVLQLAATAGELPPLHPPQPAPAAIEASQQQPVPRRSQEGSPLADSLKRRGMLLRRAASRKKVESASAGWRAGGAGAAAAAGASSGGGGGAAWHQLDPARAREKLDQALQLAGKSGIPPWQVHLAFAEALLRHNEQQWEAGAAAAELLEGSLPPLLAGGEQAAALLRALLLTVWPAASSQRPRHFACLLRLLQQCAAALEAATDPSHTWQHAGAVAVASQAAKHLLQAAAGIDARLFLQPVVQLAAAKLPDAEASPQQPAAGAQDNQAAALNLQLVQHVSAGSAPQMAAAVEQLREQQGRLAAAGQAYPCSGSSIYLALLCRLLDQQQGGGCLATAAVAGACMMR